jgi:hypothetical protein
MLPIKNAPYISRLQKNAGRYKKINMVKIIHTTPNIIFAIP